MLVSELRELLKKYNQEDLRLIVAEMYKSMPKKLREDKDTDELIKDVHGYLDIGKREKAQEKQANMEELKPKIELFIEYAYNQYYFTPNNYVHKKERPKWRFIVKQYIKDLQTFPGDTPEGKTATELLAKIYKMLSYACGYYIFNTDNPFNSVGIGQTELLDIVIKRILGNGIDRESIKSAIQLVIKSNVDRVTLNSSLINTLISNLKSTDFKEIAIEQSLKIKEEMARPVPNKKKSYSDTYTEYKREEENNLLVEIIFKLYLELCEYDKAIKYFNSNYKEWDKEVTLFILLLNLHLYGLKDYWVKVYEDAVKRGTEPRNRLRETYEYIKENGDLPEDIYI